ncbi:hypothetical protein [Streptomyces violascens]|uniref:hypothetical protein n=1 Tax=Streptomyces violascens TaxID=67381 RepID=UPI0036A75EF3
MRCVTLLGDAAHLMPPVGVGANLPSWTAPNSPRRSSTTPVSRMRSPRTRRHAAPLRRAGRHRRAIIEALMPDTDSTDADFPDFL